jgi:centrosomal protein CEP135
LFDRMDESRQLAVLRRKLDALGYAEALDRGSLELVGKLLDDLVHATDSFRAVTQQSAQQAKESAAFDARVSAR